MIIKDVQLARTGEATVLSARCKIRKIGWDTVYFSLNKTTQGAYVYNDASPFAAALLMPSMKQGENLVVKGAISQQLYKGMHAIMHQLLIWDVGLKPIEIEVDDLTADTHQPDRTASFFSGGVDSFYTYLKHKEDPADDGRINTLILANYTDVDRSHPEVWDRTLQNISAIAAAEDVELVVVRSNIHALLEPILSWDYGHGGCLAALGLTLRGAVRQVYVPSTLSVEEMVEQVPIGTSPAIDGHWSTESLSFVHDGTEATRLDKVVLQIAGSPLALEHLRVCYKNKDGAYNCGKCDKCMRTMVNLYIAAALHQSRTFPHRIDPELIAAEPTMAVTGGDSFHKENLQALREKNLAPDIQEAIITSLDNTVAIKKDRVADTREKLIYLDHVYSHGYAYSVFNRMLGRRF